MAMAAENTSGHGKTAVVPPEINRWNWGAFLLNWIWGLGNSTPIALLAFIPFFGFIWIFVLGAKGSAWAWRNRKWESVAHFRRVQRTWAFAGLGVLVVSILFFIGIFFFVIHALKGSEAYQLGVKALNADTEAVTLLGPPIETGTAMGSINTSSGGSGDAELSFSVTGTKAHGKVYLKAHREMGTWRLKQDQLEIDGRAGRIDLMK